MAEFKKNLLNSPEYFLCSLFIYFVVIDYVDVSERIFRYDRTAVQKNDAA